MFSCSQELSYKPPDAGLSASWRAGRGGENGPVAGWMSVKRSKGFVDKEEAMMYPYMASDPLLGFSTGEIAHVFPMESAFSARVCQAEAGWAGPCPPPYPLLPPWRAGMGYFGITMMIYVPCGEQVVRLHGFWPLKGTLMTVVPTRLARPHHK